MDKGITRDQVERVARVYRYNQDAARALDIDLRSFGRLCRTFGIETPYVRRRRQLVEATGQPRRALAPCVGAGA